VKHPAKRFISYIRVSTPRQGEHGVSLQEQQEAIQRYAERHSLNIVQFFEERRTAAKRGRSVWNQMLRLLRQGKAEGVIIHKIDRSARNLKDWADLGELIDAGLEVHFANESLDLQSRGGRLSADIQAVVASDYIRNLREESRKGFYGRLRQGLYPRSAPVGYLDQGRGRPKIPDPQKAPLVRKTFELYATGRYTYYTLVDEVWRLGLRNIRDGKVTKDGLTKVLNDPFYTGLIRIKTTGETFEGIHEPIVPKRLFDRVQDVLHGRWNTKGQRHDFLFRRLISCKRCGRSLIGELQKGNVYYRCHASTCRGTSIREDVIDAAITTALLPLVLNDDERNYARARIAALQAGAKDSLAEEVKAVELKLAAVEDRLRRLTDALIDGAIERDIFEERKSALLAERLDLRQMLDRLCSGQDGSVADRITEIVELAGSAYLTYSFGEREEKRDLLRAIMSNRQTDGESLILTLRLPFSRIAERLQNTCGWAHRDVPRTWDSLLHTLEKLLVANPGLMPKRSELDEILL
jgi:site-specific DNA recombinase